MLAWQPQFAFRTHGEWTALLRRLGLQVEAHHAGHRTPFASLLVIGRRGGSPLDERANVNDRAGQLAGLVLGTEPESADGM